MHLAVQAKEAGIFANRAGVFADRSMFRCCSKAAGVANRTATVLHCTEILAQRNA